MIDHHAKCFSIVQRWNTKQISVLHSCMSRNYLYASFFFYSFLILDIYIFSPHKSFSTKAIKKNVLLLCLNRAFINSRQGINARYIYMKLQFSSLKLLAVSNKVCGSYLSRWSAIPDAKAYELDINKYKIRLIYYIILSHGTP